MHGGRGHTDMGRQRLRSLRGRHGVVGLTSDIKEERLVRGIAGIYTLL